MGRRLRSSPRSRDHRTLWIAVLLLVAAISAMAMGGCSGDSKSSSPEESPQKANQTSQNPAPAVAKPTDKDVTVDMLVPSQVSISELALIGQEVDMGERSRVITRHSRFASVGNVGPAFTKLAAKAEMGSLFSVGSVSLRDGSHIHGHLRTEGNIQSEGHFTVDESVVERQPVATRHLVRRAKFASSRDQIRVGEGQKLSTPVNPGYYVSLRLGQRAEATLTAGSYYFESFVLEAGAKLNIDDSKGSIFVFVEREFDDAGTIARVNGGYPRWLVSYVGTGTVFLRKPFAGSVIAPQGTISLDGDPISHGRHEGSFYGRTVRVGPDAEIQLHDFPWIIQRVTFDKPATCNGESVHLKVEAQEPAAPGTPARVSLDGMPIAEMYDQVESAPGQHLYTIHATAADGTKESQVAPIDVASCPTTAPKLPKLFAQENVFHTDTADFSVVNAKEFEDPSTTYVWDFGDGQTVSGPLAAVSHDYSDVLPVDVDYRAFDVTVTVKRTGVADASAKRTFVLWSTYATSRARGVLEPPATALDSQLKADGTDFVAQIELKNLEGTPLEYTQRQIDQIPCNADNAIAYGGREPISLSIPAKGSVTQTFRIPQASVNSANCAVAVHYWGAVGALKAHVTVQFERPGKAGKGARVPQQLANLLNYVNDHQLVASLTGPAKPRASLTATSNRISEEQFAALYRERKIPASALQYLTPKAGLMSETTPRETCDPDNPGAPPQPGFSCQPTGQWEGTGPGEQPMDEHIENALKGDAIVVRSCTGMIAPLLGAVDPPQKYTHSGIMTKHRFEITHSTGDDDYLVKEHPSGVFGQPTDGFQEYALRYLWPGTITASVREAFAGEGRLVSTPEGKPWRVRGFERLQVRCPGDAQIVYPRVLKPPPEYEQEVRPKLMAAADAAKTIHGHYRFYSYSNAPDTETPDPNGPGPVSGSSGIETYGKVPTVCSSFVRLALKKAGFVVDQDKALPKPSDVTNGPPDGIFFYDVQERKHAGNVLYSGLYDTVQYQLSRAGSSLVDDAWWGGSNSYNGPLWNGAGMLSSFLASSGPIAGWLTDAPNDIANQIANCFASDFCSEAAKDSDAWREPGNGFAVSPDNLVDHFDSPATGGPYGYSERMIYRGKDYRQVFEWRPAEGTMPLDIHVFTQDGYAVPFAQVEVRGFTPNPVTANAIGVVLVEGVPRGNIMIHGQKFIDNELREGDACYVPAEPSNPNSATLRRVDCSNFSQYLDNEVYYEARVYLKPPRAEFRAVVFDGIVDLKDCDCGSADEWNHPVMHRVCLVNPLHRDDDVGMEPGELCSDEVGLRFHAHCQLQPDNRTVRIWQDYWFYENVSPTCGGNDLEDERHHQFDVLQDQTLWPAQETLVNGGTCGFSSCDDFATIRNLSILNRRAD
ncbi:hypothetical protein LZC95_44580 [Pendulispora brunnea]|uniref:PKD domain-containing protein n=1 Tax=Pendulispora brunnea TaxID=2905690 RepID=A0ABZ2K8A0_9BACT